MYQIESELTEPEDMPMCPLCENPIMNYEKAGIGSAFGLKCLVHLYCVLEEEDD